MSGASSSDALAACLQTVARDIFGEPTSTLGDEIRFRTHGSLSVHKTKGFTDHEADAKGGTLAFLALYKQFDKAAALAWLVQHRYIDPPKSLTGASPPFKIAATYDYRDEIGTLLFQVCRMEPKSFRQRKPDAIKQWDWKVEGVRRVIYRLPHVIKAIEAGEIVFVVEGEKSADRLTKLGITATCSPGGANKFRTIYAPTFNGANVVILPDNDLPGQTHAVAVAKVLDGVAAHIRTLNLPGLPDGGDVVDWLDAGGTVEALAGLVNATPVNTKPPPTATKEELEDGHGCLTEDAVALAFTEKHCNDLRFDHHVGAWYRWTGAAWTKEVTKLAFSWARQAARRLAKLTPDDSVLVMAGKASFSAGVERFAQADRAFAVTSAIWDADPWLLGTPGGTVDLRTGKMRPARQSDFITKLTSVAPAATAHCPQWLAFLNQATDGNQELVDFLQRWFGYTLTGITREHALLFVFGDGGNGKGVCMNTIAAILHDYCVTAAMDTFTVSKGDKHPTDMAMLAGARMVMVNEVEEGAAWDESRLKTLTGGDPITARYMRKDFFTYLPFFKLTISGNHKPALKNVDEAARRRTNLAPFLHRPPVVDKLLPDKLKAEWPGILRWLIDGCLKWQTDGLKQPDVVKVATQEYFLAQDIVGKWIAEKCKIFPTLEMKPGLLLADCRAWAAANGEEVPTPSAFRGALERVKGVRYVTVKGLGWVKGIGLNAPDQSEGGGRWGQ